MANMDFLFLYMMLYNINKVLEHFDKVKFGKKFHICLGKILENDPHIHNNIT